MKSQTTQSHTARLIDKDLRFLASCTNDELRTLCDILTHDRMGNLRLTEQLTNTDSYLRCYPEQMMFLAPDIANELLRFGSNTLTTFWKGQPDSYATVLRHVCKQTGVELHDKDDVATTERHLLTYLCQNILNRMSEYSADRCAAAVVGERVFQSALLKLTSGLTNIQGDPYQLVEQAKIYNEMKSSSLFSRTQQACRVALYSHPQNCQRAYEVDRWKSSANYRILTQNL